MVAQRLSGDIRWLVVGSPDYFARHSVPSHPRDLTDHRCLGVRLGDDSIYRWEFEKDGEELDIDVPGAITLDQTQFALDLASAGTGLAYLPEPSVAPIRREGPSSAGARRLVPNGAWIPTSTIRGDASFPTGLRLLIDLIRELKPLGL